MPTNGARSSSAPGSGWNNPSLTSGEGMIAAADDGCVTFLTARLDPYCSDGEKPRSAARAAGAQSGKAFEEGPGKADARQGGAPGHAGTRPVTGGTPQSGHRPRPCRHRRADGKPAPLTRPFGP